MVLFLNDKIIGDYAVVEVDNSDVRIEKCKVPIEYINKLKKADKLSESNLTKKQAFNQLDFNECDFVELLVEKDGIHKGDTGVVAIDYSIGDSVLVDFSGIDKNGNYYGDCIEVNISDLKKINS